MTTPSSSGYPPPPPPGPAYQPPAAPQGASYPPPAPPPPSPYPPPAQYPQQQPPGAYQQPGYGAKAPSPNWALSIIGVLCFLVTGIVAVYFSSQVATRWNQGDVAGAQRASNGARTWGIVSIVIGVLVIIIYASQGGSSTT